MAGIYIHIPFCKQACYYCNFHFRTNLRLKKPMLLAIEKELQLQQNYLQGAKIKTIYFGGGTPSLLEVEEINAILIAIKKIFVSTDVQEITLEVNPDDLTKDKLAAWQAIGINRLSVGIQTFNDELLRSLNRAHDAAQAITSLRMITEVGFSNFSVDLIYAIAGQSAEMLKKDLAFATQFQPTHISAYCLTIETDTVFGHWLKTGKIQMVDEETAAQQFHTVVETLAEKNYEQYEISNFSLPGFYAQHNTSYWTKDHYLGIGPSAHSYNGTSRQHNIAHNQQYINDLESGTIPSTEEVLSIADHINEYIMTSLRTCWGCSMRYLQATYQYDFLSIHFSYIKQITNLQLAYIKGDTLFLTQAGKLLADKIAADLFVV